MPDSRALDTLVNFLESHFCPVTLGNYGTIAYQRAVYHPLLDRFQHSLRASQTFKPDVNTLLRHKFSVQDSLQSSCDALIFTATRQRKESQFLLANGINYLRTGGVFLGCVENSLGGKSYRSYAAELCCGEIDSAPLNRCTIFWAHKRNVNPKLMAQWLALGYPQIVHGTSFHSRVGIFGWNKVDAGSTLLASQFSREIRGRVADFGAGYGFLSYNLLDRCPDIEELWVYEAEKVALECARKNLSRQPAKSVTYIWSDLCSETPQIEADWVIMNPPCHANRVQTLEVALGFFNAAFKALQRNGTLLFVANVTLPYEHHVAALFGNCTCLAKANGFKVLMATKKMK